MCELRGRVLMLVRDTIERTYESASGLRVQDVFAGITAAQAFPNAQVKTIFERSQQRVDVSALRTEVLERLVSEIAKLNRIKTAIDLGS